MRGMMGWSGVCVVGRVIEGRDVMGRRVLAAHGVFVRMMDLVRDLACAFRIPLTARTARALLLVP